MPKITLFKCLILFCLFLPSFGQHHGSLRPVDTPEVNFNFPPSFGQHHGPPRPIDTPEFIKKYLKDAQGPTHAFRLRAEQVYEVDCIDCGQDSLLGQKRLLWHGTREENINSILQNGFSINKASGGGLFGPGIYFADCPTKSAHYTRSFSTPPPIGFSGYMFLCEVALGNSKPLIMPDRNAAEKLGTEYNSVRALGRFRPSESNSMFFDGKNMIASGSLQDFGPRPLEYNEYIVYSENQARIKYLVKVAVVDKQMTLLQKIFGLFYSE